MSSIRSALVGLLAASAALSGCRMGNGHGPTRDPVADEEVGRSEPPQSPPSSQEAPRPEFRQESPKSQKP